MCGLQSVSVVSKFGNLCMTRDDEKAPGDSSLNLESARKAADESIQCLRYSEVISVCAQDVTK